LIRPAIGCWEWRLFNNAKARCGILEIGIPHRALADKREGCYVIEVRAGLEFDDEANGGHYEGVAVGQQNWDGVAAIGTEGLAIGGGVAGVVGEAFEGVGGDGDGLGQQGILHVDVEVEAEAGQVDFLVEAKVELLE
jgi:hypothetical protein